MKPGESTTRGRPRLRPAGLASRNALVRVLLNASAGTPVIPVPFRRSSDSFGVMYGARRPPGDFAGYHRETMSSLAFTPGTQGSGRERSLRCRDVVPTGWGPVGLGRYGAPIEVPTGVPLGVPSGVPLRAAEGPTEAGTATVTVATDADTVEAEADVDAQGAATTRASSAATTARAPLDTGPAPLRSGFVPLERWSVRVACSPGLPAPSAGQGSSYGMERSCGFGSPAISAQSTVHGISNRTYGRFTGSSLPVRSR
ncbi:hypothetical protein GCM10010140_20720 [Streptosporangium pseudovulgare]|uniref:Uncharacterized protein n=1 Tax=Streptosporangium pseudovulgare TaxID=35765 RepID=A0ABQ2QRW2_9ACTN|nr:hypothetical protein GCM10010140_20720 [Streptosporangium pseudovulgare]